jgi:hypothetical protein
VLLARVRTPINSKLSLLTIDSLLETQTSAITAFLEQEVSAAPEVESWRKTVDISSQKLASFVLAFLWFCVTKDESYLREYSVKMPSKVFRVV